MLRHEDSRRRWLSGLSIIVTAMICLFGFWRLSPGVTFVVTLAALAAMLFFLWRAGRH